MALILNHFDSVYKFTSCIKIQFIITLLPTHKWAKKEFFFCNFPPKYIHAFPILLALSRHSALLRLFTHPNCKVQSSCLSNCLEFLVTLFLWGLVISPGTLMTLWPLISLHIRHDKTQGHIYFKNYAFLLRVTWKNSDSFTMTHAFNSLFALFIHVHGCGTGIFEMWFPSSFS